MNNDEKKYFYETESIRYCSKTTNQSNVTAYTTEWRSKGWQKTGKRRDSPTATGRKRKAMRMNAVIQHSRIPRETCCKVQGQWINDPILHKFNHNQNVFNIICIGNTKSMSSFCKQSKIATDLQFPNFMHSAQRSLTWGNLLPGVAWTEPVKLRLMWIEGGLWWPTFSADVGRCLPIALPNWDNGLFEESSNGWLDRSSSSIFWNMRETHSNTNSKIRKLRLTFHQ